MTSSKIRTLVISDPEDVKIISEGVAAMRELLQLLGVRPDYKPSVEDYDKILKHIGANISGEDFVKLQNALYAANEEAANELKKSE